MFFIESVAVALRRLSIWSFRMDIKRVKEKARVLVGLLTDGEISFRFMLLLHYLPNSTSWRYCGLCVINFCWSYWKSASSSAYPKKRIRDKNRIVPVHTKVTYSAYVHSMVQNVSLDANCNWKSIPYIHIYIFQK